MERVLVQGRQHSGKTITALKQAVSYGHQEIVFVSDSLHPGEVGFAIGSAFPGASVKMISENEFIIDECVRITAIDMRKTTVSNLRGIGCNVLISDMNSKNFDIFIDEYIIPKDVFIEVKLLRKYNRVITTKEV